MNLFRGARNSIVVRSWDPRGRRNKDACLDFDQRSRQARGGVRLQIDDR